jgi:hypothetical protein
MAIDEEEAKIIATQFLGQYHNVVKIDAALGGGRTKKRMETHSTYNTEDN